MVVKEEFEIFISKDGKIKMVAKGFGGNKCQQPLKRLTDILSPTGKVLEKGSTWEAHQVEIELADSVKVTGPKDEGNKK